MDEVISNAPSWLKWGGAAGGAIVAGALFLRQYLSGAKLDRTANESNVATILRLQDEVRQERDRADALMHEREDMIRKIGELEGKVDSLSRQVDMLVDLVASLKGATQP